MLRITRTLTQTRAFTVSATLQSAHVLHVPEHTLHEAVTPFQNGVPVNQVRALKESEKEWEFWTSSNAFNGKDAFPSPFGFIYVPFGQTWVLNNGKALQTGVHFITPLLQKIVAIKDSEMVTSGVLTSSAPSKNGKLVNAYAVVYFKVKDAVKSALYVDPVTKKVDSERALSRLLRRTLETEISKYSANEDGTLNESDKKSLNEKLLSVAQEKALEFGLEILCIEMRGAFPADLQVPEKLRALELPPRDENAFGARLSNDYWADVITPQFFEKYKFGGRKEYKTMATNDLVWSIPSPPDFHHFNHVPRITETPISPKA